MSLGFSSPGLTIIGVGFQMQMGKDTIGKYLVEQHGFVRLAFADPLKDAATAIFGFDREKVEHADYKAEVDPYWQETRRRMLQVLGTECMRKGFRDDVWVRALERRIAALPSGARGVVVTDVRFRNEVDAIKSWGGKAWRVFRPKKDIVAGAGLEADAADLRRWLDDSRDAMSPQQRDVEVVRTLTTLLSRHRSGGAPKHVSEAELDTYDGWDAVIINDSTFEDLFAKVDAELAR